MRRFNTAGPCLPEYHYMIPALRRLPGGPRPGAPMGHFLGRAPRPAGETTVPRGPPAPGCSAAPPFPCDPARAGGGDSGGAHRGPPDKTRPRAETPLPPALPPPAWPHASDANLLTVALTAWARVCPHPLVLF